MLEIFSSILRCGFENFSKYLSKSFWLAVAEYRAYQNGIKKVMSHVFRNKEGIDILVPYFVNGIFNKTMYYSFLDQKNF